MLLLSIQLRAQSFNPVSWDIELSCDNFLIGDEIEIIFKIKIKEGWSLCFSESDLDYKKLESGICIFDSPSFQIVDDIIYFGETTKKEIRKNNCITCFKKNITFKQNIKIVATPMQLTGILSYIVFSGNDIIYLQERFEVKSNGMESPKVRTYPL